MTTSTTNPALFITDYASYNAGLQFVCGKWYDLTEFNSVDELLEEIQTVYNEFLNNPENEEERKLYIENCIDYTDISNLELMITDFEGFPREMYSESFDTVLIGQLIENIDIIQEFKNIDEDNLVNYYNQNCEINHLSDDMIYSFDEDFFDACFTSKFEVARAVAFGDVNFGANYITFNGYGNLETIESVTNYIDKESLLIDMIKNRHQYDM